MPPDWTNKQINMFISSHIKLSGSPCFVLTCGDSQISFKGVIPNGDLVYRQYCLLLAPKHTLKISSCFA